MKKNTNSKLISIIIFILSIVVFVKIVWIIIAFIFLPKSGEEHLATNKLKPLYYPIKLANSSPTIRQQAPVTIKPKVKPVGTMQGYMLLALYNASDKLVVTIAKNKKTKVLSRGEDMDGFVLKSAGSNYAIFTKGGKEFELLLKGSKNKTSDNKRNKNIDRIHKDKKIEKTISESEDGVSKVVSKGLLSSYTKDIDKVWKDIGIGDYKVNGKLQGFKVNFVKRGSDFEKLGLQKGDILTSVNGQELNSYNAAFGFFKEIDSIDNLTLNIKRNNQEMELEYEIQ